MKRLMIVSTLFSMTAVGCKSEGNQELKVKQIDQENLDQKADAKERVFSLSDLRSHGKQFAETQPVESAVSHDEVLASFLEYLENMKDEKTKLDEGNAGGTGKLGACTIPAEKICRTTTLAQCMNFGDTDTLFSAMESCDDMAKLGFEVK